MTEELAKSKKPSEKPSALTLMANRLNVEPEKLLETLKATVFKGASNQELLALVVVANEYGLNPLLKEIYAFPAKGGGIVPVVGIDGWLKMINRHAKFDGLDSPVAFGNEGKPESCTCSIWVKGRKHPVRVTEYYDECYRATEPWKIMPARMLRHKAISQCARVAFGFSGIQDEDEARDTMKAQAYEVIPSFDLPKAKAEIPEYTGDEDKDYAAYQKLTPVLLLRRKLKESSIEEKVFCDGLTLLGYEIEGAQTLDNLESSLLKQLATMDMGKLLDEMEAKANA